MALQTNLKLDTIGVNYSPVMILLDKYDSSSLENNFDLIWEYISSDETIVSCFSG